MAAKDGGAKTEMLNPEMRRSALLGAAGKSMRSMAHLTGSRVFTRSTLNFYTGGGKDERATQQRVDYENTYKTKPDVKFNTKKVGHTCSEIAIASELRVVFTAARKTLVN